MKIKRKSLKIIRLRLVGTTGFKLYVQIIVTDEVVSCVKRNVKRNETKIIRHANTEPIGVGLSATHLLPFACRQVE